VFGIIGATWKESTIDFVNISPWRYLLTQPLVLLYYLRLAIWPSPLVLTYGWLLEDQWPRIVFPGLAVLGMLAVMFRGIRRRAWYGFVAAWFFLILAPTSSIAPMRQAIFEHRMYLSLAAVVVLAVVGAEHAIRKLAADPKRRALLGWCLGIAVVIVLGYLAHDRNRDYHSEKRMWQDNAAHRPQSQFAHNGLGWCLLKEGRYPEAARHLQWAVAIDPDYGWAHHNLGDALTKLGRPGQAVEHYRQALRLKGDFADAHNNLGNALLALGRPHETLTHCAEALRIKPDMAEAHFNMGNALATLGRSEEAIAHYQRALQLKPRYPEACNNLGVVCRAAGRIADAITCFEHALRLEPESAAAQKNLRETREMLGEGGE